MPTNNPFPLNIPQKVNSPELLAFFQQFGLDKYLSAEEINKLTQAVQYLYENMGGSPGALPDVVLTVGDLTDLGGNEFEFGTGYSWRLGGTEYENSSPITVVINPASEGFYRIDVAYVTNEGEILIQEGEESEDVAVEPSIPTGTLKLRTFNVFGDVVSIGGGIPLPFDMTLLDELLELDPSGYVWMNIDGLDVRFQLQLLLDYLNGSNSDFFDLNILGTEPSTPSAGITRLFSLANTISFIFADGQQIKIIKNTSQNGTLTMPFHSGRIEIVRPIQNITGTTTYNFQESDTSRGCRVASGNMDFVIPNSVSGNHKYLVVNQSTGVVRVTTAGTYRINGAFTPVTLPQGEFYITRTANLDFIITLPGGAPSWGSITGVLSSQTDLMNALNAKRDLPDLKELTAEHNLLNQVTLQSLGFIHDVVPGTYELLLSVSLSSLAASGNIQFGTLGSATVTNINGKSFAIKQTLPNTLQGQDINTSNATAVSGASAVTSGVMTVILVVKFSTAGNFIPSAGFGTAPSAGKVSIGSFSLMQKI